MIGIFLVILFYFCFFLLVLAIGTLPLSYTFTILGMIILGCLYWIYRIIKNPNLMRSEKWDRLTGRSW